MNQKTSALLLVFGLAAVVAAMLWLLRPDGGSADPRGGGAGGEEAGVAPLQAAASPAQVPVSEAAAAAVDRDQLAASRRGATVRGRVLDTRTGDPISGVEVLAMRQPPSFERLFSRFRGLFRNGLWSEANEPVEILGRALSAADGSFEITGLPAGMVFLDGRSERVYVRTPAALRLAEAERRDGVELLGAAGGRIRGQVFGPDGLPASGAVVNLRPGVNAFLGQITQRKYRWLETRADGEGKFEIAGVPTGSGYTLSATARLMALAETHGLLIEEGKTTTVTIRGQAGAALLGRVLDAQGKPVAGANVAMVYLDISRVLFSADGRDEPIVSDADGSFRLEHVAPGRVAFAAAADGIGSSDIQERAVVDGGYYDDLVLTIGEGQPFSGLVVDDQDRPLAGAEVELRPFEQPTDPDVLKMALRIRSVKAKSAGDGRFEARGLTGRNLMLQVSKPGYVTSVRFGVKLDERDVRVVLQRGCTIRGKVALADMKPVPRFRVETRSRELGPDGKERAESRPADADGQARVGFGPQGGGRNRMGRGSLQIREGQRLGDQGFEGNWQEVQAADGSFELRGIPPGKVRVRVRAEGYLDPDSQEVVLAAGQTSEPLAFVIQSGAIARGLVLDDATGQPVAEAMVTAYRVRGASEDEARGMPFRLNADPEDLDFLGMSAMDGRRSVQTDSKGRFEVKGLAAAHYRFTARHPDRAKASAKDIDIVAAQPTEGIVIRLTAGGAVEGNVTGQGMRPLADALIVVGSIQAGSMKSVATNAQGYFKLEGLPPGQYVVFKSRLEEQSQNLGYDLLGNMRMKTVGVREGKTSRVDIHDETEDGVRVFGVVRDGAETVKRAMVTALSNDRDGILGMGIRAKPTDEKGEYELIGLKPGTYFFQVARFQQRPQQTSLQIEVPPGVREMRLDLEIPQSYVVGVVLDRAGAPVRGIQVQAGVVEGGLADAEGLLGLIMKNGVNQARTDDQGRFKLSAMSAATYRITATGRGRGAEATKYGDAFVEDVRVDGRSPIDNLTIVLPTAGSLTGLVVDGSGNPVVGAEIHYVGEKRGARASEQALNDLFGIPVQPTKTGSDGRFQISRVTPGKYRVRADAQGLAPGTLDDVVVAEAQATEIKLTVIKGATLRLRATNVDGSRIPLANITVLDGSGKPLANKVSVLSVMRRFMLQDEKKEDTGWREVGNVPPDTYTVIITEKGKPEVRTTKTLRDGETVEWDIDVAAELKAAGRERK